GRDVACRENRRLRAPEVADARVVPRDPVLVRLGGVVLLRHVIEEQAVGQRLVSVRMAARDVDADEVLVADVLGERLTAIAVHDDDAGRPLKADEEVVLAALVVVEAADDALPRADEIRLPDRLRELRRAHDLAEPAPLVVEAAQRDPTDAVNHVLSGGRRATATTNSGEHAREGLA